MKIPISWLKEYIKTDKNPKQIAQIFTELGLLLDKPIETTQSGEVVLDLEHRMDRSDWLGILGCARDFAAFENTPLTKPQGYKKEGLPNGGITIDVQCDDVIRFNTRVFKNINVKPSPDWLKNRLEAYGIPSINNIVDITNYVMVELGQPMHAQDINKMEKPEIVIRKARNGEKITTLLGQTLELNDQIFVLTQNNTPTVIGGIVGGNSTGVDENTTQIVLDSGCYNQNSVRRASRMLKIQNETVLRYDKFLHPQATQLAIERATSLILELAGGDYYENDDYYPNKWDLQQKTINLQRIKKVGGIDFTLDQVENILQRLEYEIISKNQNSLTVQVPYFRTDVQVEDDLVADVLRIYGYSNITPQALEYAPPKEITPEIYNFEQQIREILVKFGADEHITDPLVQKNDDNAIQVKLQNSLTFDKSALRTTIFETLDIVANTYKKHGINPISIFEVGKTYSLHGPQSEFESYIETREVCFIHKNSLLSLSKNNEELKSILFGFFRDLGIKDVFLQKISDNEAKIYQDDIFLGHLYINHFTLLTQNLMTAKINNYIVSTSVPTYSTQTMTFTVNTQTTIGEIYKAIIKSSDDVTSAELTDVYQNEKSAQQNTKSVTFTVVTSKKVDVNTLHANISNILKP